jgi:hypothetical protein
VTFIPEELAMRHTFRRNRALAVIVSAAALGVGFGQAVAAPQPATNAEAAKRAATAEPASPVYVMSDVTRQVESFDHQALVDSQMLILADYLPPYITPYSKTKDASQPDGVRFRPDLCTLGKPDKSFFYVMPGAIESIIDDQGSQVPAATLKGLQMWAVAMDGDGRKTSGTVFALRAQLPDGIWKPWEVRGYVNGVLGDGVETVDLGQVDFRPGGKAEQLGFEFKEVTWDAKHTSVKFTAVSDPRVWVIKSDITIGDEKKVVRGSANAQWTPPDRLGPASGLAATGVFTTTVITDLPSTVHVKAQYIKNARVVRVPFVFRTGPDDVVPPNAIPVGKKGQPTLPNYVMGTSVTVFADPPPPAPKPVAAPAVAPAPAPAAKPPTPAPQVAKPAPPPAAAPAPPKPAPAPVKHAPNLPTVPADLISSYVNGNLPKPAPPPPAPTVTSYRLDPDPPPAAPRAPAPEPPPVPKQAEAKPAAPPAPAVTATVAAPEPVTTPAVVPPAAPIEPAPAAAAPTVKDKKDYKIHDKFGSDDQPEAGR